MERFNQQRQRWFRTTVAASFSALLLGLPQVADAKDWGRGRSYPLHYRGIPSIHHARTHQPPAYHQQVIVVHHDDDRHHKHHRKHHYKHDDSRHSKHHYRRDNHREHHDSYRSHHYYKHHDHDDAYYCKPCGHRYGDRDQFYRHLHHHHHLPFHHMPGFIFSGQFGWYFPGF